MILALALAALFSTAELEIEGKKLIVEIADTPEALSKGLSGRKELPEGTGMLFVFKKPAPLSFWMKDTLIPLCIGYFDADKKLINIEEMTPPKEGASSFLIYKSLSPALYALEVPSGWFSKNGIRKGSKFTLQDRAESVK